MVCYSFVSRQTDEDEIKVEWIAPKSLEMEERLIPDWPLDFSQADVRLSLDIPIHYLSMLPGLFANVRDPNSFGFYEKPGRETVKFRNRSFSWKILYDSSSAFSHTEIYIDRLVEEVCFLQQELRVANSVSAFWYEKESKLFFFFCSLYFYLFVLLFLFSS